MAKMKMKLMNRTGKIKTVRGLIQELNRWPTNTMCKVKAETIFTMINGRIVAESGLTAVLRLPPAK